MSRLCSPGKDRETRKAGDAGPALDLLVVAELGAERGLALLSLCVVVEIGQTSHACAALWVVGDAVGVWDSHQNAYSQSSQVESWRAGEADEIVAVIVGAVGSWALTHSIDQ